MEYKPPLKFPNSNTELGSFNHKSMTLTLVETPLSKKTAENSEKGAEGKEQKKSSGSIYRVTVQIITHIPASPAEGEILGSL